VADTTGRFVDWRTPSEPIDYYCEGLAIAPSERKVTIIGGNPGAGKGPLAGYLAVCFAFGLRAFGEHPCRECRVGVLDFEGAGLSRRRLESYARGFGLAPSSLQGRVFLRDTDPSEMLDLGWVHELVDSLKLEVLVIDSYMSAVSGSDIDPNGQEFAWLARELGKLGIVVLIVAHARKPSSTSKGERPLLGDLAGSFALGGMAATGLGLWRADEDEPMQARVGCMRAPEEGFRTFDLQWTRHEDGAWTGEVLGEVTRETVEAAKGDTSDKAATVRVRRVVSHMLPNAGFPQGISGIATATGLEPKHCGEVLAALARAGWAHHEADATGKGGGRYQLDCHCPDAARLSIVGGEATETDPGEGHRVGGQFRRDES
jgi:hypothetical protein